MKKSFLLICLFLGLKSVAQDKSNTKNILSASPVSLSQHTPTGFGVQYERSIDNDGKVSFYLPVSYNFGNSDPCDKTVKSHILSVAPGIKYYPKGNDRKVSYAIGASIVAATGNSNCQCDVIDKPVSIEHSDAEMQETGVTKNPYGPVRELGGMLVNSININASPKIFIGSDLGVGAGYSKYKSESGAAILFQFSVKAGYKF
jgi:hypothetical protein